MTILEKLCQKSDDVVSSSDDIHVSIPENFLGKNYTEPEEIPLDIFYEDKSLIVINKPKGLLVHPAQDIQQQQLWLLNN